MDIGDYVTILKRRGIYTNIKQVKDIFSIADRWVLFVRRIILLLSYRNSLLMSKRFVKPENINNVISFRNMDSILSKSELRAELKRLANTEKAYGLMDSDT